MEGRLLAICARNFTFKRVQDINYSIISILSMFDSGIEVQARFVEVTMSAFIIQFLPLK